MEVQTKKSKSHSKKYRQNLQTAKSKIKEAEESMKKMDQEVKEFHSHMQAEVAQLMLTLTSGSNVLDQTKKDE
jgi:multidrug resistance efflux pump